MKTLKQSLAVALVVAFASVSGAYALEPASGGVMKGLDVNASSLYESGFGFRTDTASKVFYKDATNGVKSWAAYNGGANLLNVKGII